ncbi:alpha/beta fold hydrolase [Novosphingobium tardum]|uniref:Alpha/beta fold hydrolase n=1 Tax=Novosphingobium tardum TaxID=1538021 RepID=A0ABV8RLY3_9SPHN
MTMRQFKGFGGVRLEAEELGDDNDPAVLLVHGPGQTRAVWNDTAAALVRAGRRVVALDLRGHGDSEWPSDGRYEFDAFVEDIRAVLAQLETRPVVVAATLGGWIATMALATDAPLLAAGLVLVDMPARGGSDIAAALGERLTDPARGNVGRWDERLISQFRAHDIAARLPAAAPGIALPTLVVRGGLSWLEQSDDSRPFNAALPNGECVDLAEEDLLLVTDRTEAFMGVLLDFLERKQPRAAAEFRAGSDARTLRDALGCFATGVTIVTARDADGVPVGLTANSFTSLSLDPPLLLVCVANTSGSAAVLREASHFAVNVLQIGQQPTSNRFAGRNEDRFGQTAWEEGEQGIPVLTGSLGIFECSRHAVHEGGDHFILVGKVERAQFEPRRDPLLYFRGKYRRLHFA